jgi:superoxide reductase
MQTAVKCEKNLLCGVNMVKDPLNMTDLEKKHLPVITAPLSISRGECFEVMIEIGKYMEHPNEPGHFIEFIELYADETYLGKLELTAQTTCPTLKLPVALDHIHESLRAFTRCNLHGTWEGRSAITVTD